MYDLLITNGRLVTSDRIVEADIGISEGKFAAFLDKGTPAEAKEVIDAAGKLLFPGIIDCHAHLNEPGFTWREDFATGSRAAAVGGTTTLIDMPLNNDPPLINSDVFRMKFDLIDKKAVVDYALWGGLIDDNYNDLVGLQECGVAAFKAFVCPCGKPFPNVNMGQVKAALELLKPYGALCGFHCEEYGMILEAEKKAQEEGRNTVRDFLDAHDVLSEYLAVQNILTLCRATGGRVHICHVSHPKVAQLVKEAIHEGLPVTAETCPHYLGFTEELVLEKGAPAKCTPPLRDREAVEGLWEYVLDGTLSCVGSDHSPADEKEKDNNTNTIWTAWGGLNAIGFLLPMMFDLAVHQRGLSPTLLTRVLDENPAKIFGLYGRKGAFELGFDADVVILDPELPWEVNKETLLTMNKVSAFEGVKGKGHPTHTIVRGRVVAENGKYHEDAFGYGEFLNPSKISVKK